MKKVILLVSILFISVSSFSQKTPGWYDYIKVTQESSPINYNYYMGETLFPDSTVIAYVPITDTSITSHISYVNLHNVGQLFEPTFDFYYDDMRLGDTCAYDVDSVGFYYLYKHYVPNSVDTLRFQFYSNDNIKEVYYDSLNFTSYTVQYNSESNTSTSGNFGKVAEILLTEADTTDTIGWWVMKFIKVAVPNGPIRVSAGMAAGFSVTFHPGYSYNHGDTIDYRLNSVKKLNQFIPITLMDRDKFPIASKHQGLFSNKITRYNFLLQQWDTFFIPGDAYPTFNKFLHAAFHAYGCFVGVNNTQKPVFNLSIYPNPVDNSQQLNIDFELAKQEELIFTITDITGRVVKEIDAQTYQQGKHTLNADISDLNAGMYYVTISGASGKTAQPLVVH